MRLSFLTLFTLFASGLYAQFNIIEGPLAVSGGLGYNHPQIEMLGDGNPGIIWTDGSGYQLYFSKYDGAGSFTSPIQLNPTGQDVQSYNWSGPDIAVEGDNVYVSYKAFGYDTAPTYLVKSTNNGATWSDTVRIDNLATGFAQYPDLAVLNDTVYVTFMDHDAAGLNPQYVLARSTDGGATFEPEVPVTALVGDEACDCCQPEIVVNDQYVIVYFRNNASDIRDIKAVISYDRGETFGTWYSADDHFWSIASCPSTGPDAHFLDDETVLSAYRSKDGLDFKVYLNEFEISGLTNVNTIEVNSTTGSGNGLNYPQFSTDNGEFAIVWEELDQSGDVFVNASSSGLAGIDASNALNITDATGTQNKPDVVLRDGVIHVCYTDVASPSGVYYLKLSSALVGLSNESSPLDVSIFPNPASDFLTVKCDSHLSLDLEIVNINGKLVLSQKVVADELVQIADLPKGVYLLTVTEGENGEQKSLPLVID